MCSLQWNALDCASLVWLQLPALVDLKFLSPTLADARAAMQYLPNPGQLKTLDVAILPSHIHEVPQSARFWELTPHIETLRLIIYSTEITVGAWLSMYESWTTLTCLQEFVLSVDYTDIDELPPTPFPSLPSMPFCLEKLKVGFIDDWDHWSPLAFLLSHFPSLCTLHLSNVGSLHPTTLHMLAKDIFPRLQQFQWEGYGVKLMVSVPTGESLGSLMINPEDITMEAFVSEMDMVPQELTLLRFIKEQSASLPRHYQAFLGVSRHEKSTFTFDNLFSSVYRTGLQNITDLDLFDVPVVLGGVEWARWLAFGCLQSLQLRRCTGLEDSFVAAMNWCFALRWTSTTLTKLGIQTQKEPLLGVPSLLSAVFPSLTLLSYQVDAVCSDIDLICVLRLPKLQMLAIGDSSGNHVRTLLTLESITAEMWEIVSSSGTICDHITLLGLPLSSWPALQRFLGSSLGRRMKQVSISTNKVDEWKAMVTSSNPRYRVRVLKFDEDALLLSEFTTKLEPM